MKSPATILCITVATLLSGMVSAHAGPCTSDIARIENTLRSVPSSLARPSARQTIGAQLGHQPTQQSVMAAEEEAQAGLHATLARARAFDAEGRGAECAQAVRDAKVMLGLE
jgi:hypothetical protein